MRNCSSDYFASCDELVTLGSAAENFYSWNFFSVAFVVHIFQFVAKTLVGSVCGFCYTIVDT